MNQIIYICIYIYVCVCVCVCIHTLFFRFFSHIGHYRVLSRVPCTVPQVLTI